jgi:predicted RNase H-like HicB family nuclease
LEDEFCSMSQALRYVVILKPDPADGGFNVHIPAFPHAHTQGNDAKDAVRSAREVIELEIEVMIEHGETLSESDGDADIRARRDYAARRLVESSIQ